MFSATSLADARNAAGSALSRQRALDRARRHLVTGPAQEQLRGQRRHRAPFAFQIRGPGGGGAFDGVGEEVDRRADEPACELRAHTCLVDLAGRDRLQALEYAATVNCPIGLTPGDVEVSRRRRVSQRLGEPRRKRCTGKTFVPPLPVTVLPQHICRSSRRPLLGCAAVVRRRPRRDMTDSRSTRRPPRRRPRRPAATSNTASTSTAEAVTDGAITAPEPNHSPISAAGGASPWRAAAPATARSTTGGLPRSPSRSIRTDSACQTRRVISRRISTPASFSGFRIT